MTIDEQRVDWLYARFNAISEATNKYLGLLGVVTAFSIAAALTARESFTIPLLELEVSRDLALGAAAVLGPMLFLAHCGAFDLGEETLRRLCAVLKCDYTALDLVDNHPNLLDFVRHARPQVASKRGYLSRLTHSLLYPIALLLTLAWYTWLILSELYLRPVRGVPLLFYGLGLITALVAWARATDYLGRRWRSWRNLETGQESSPAQPTLPAA